ncbi:MAG: DUF928 domain-containing protein [Terriglobales bacterium]
MKVACVLILAVLLQPGSAQDKKPVPAADKKPKRQRVVTSMAGFDLLASQEVRKQTMVAGGTRGEPSPVPLAPRLGRLYGTNPTLAWSFEDGTHRHFLVIVWDDTQNEIWRADVTGFRYRYPREAAPLEPGKTYFWTVELPAGVLGGLPSAPAGLLMLSREQRAELETRLHETKNPDAFREGLGRAQAFTDARLWYDALATYDDLIERVPGNAQLHEARGAVYAQLEATRALAEQDWARADALAETSP